MAVRCEPISTQRLLCGRLIFTEVMEMNGDPDPAPIQRIPSQPFMEQKPQARSPDLTLFRPLELSTE